MRRRLRFAGAAVAAALALAPDLSSAHLRPVGGSLVEVVRGADAVVVAEALAPSRDRPGAGTVETHFRTLSRVAGEDPGDVFVVVGTSPALRYAQGQRAIVLVERSGDEWRATQPAGMGLVLANDEETAEAATLLASLWSATRGEPRPDELAAVLRRGIRARSAKVRLLAALDLAELVDHRQVGAETRAAIRGDLAAPDLDRAVRVALAAAFADERAEGSVAHEGRSTE